jgi:hypothetical protein
MMLQRLPCLAALVVLVAGCGGGPYAPISGQVKLNGQPLAGAAVTFQPYSRTDLTPGPGSGAVTDADGRYRLKVIGKETLGAVVGMHKVRITMFQKDDSADDRPPKLSKTVPARYNSKDTPLEFDVPAAGSDSADFSLTSP